MAEDTDLTTAGDGSGDASAETFSRDDLLERAREFGISRHAMAGALTLARDGQQNFKRKTAEALVEKFQKNKVN